MSRRLTADRAAPAPQINLRLPVDLEAAIDAMREQLERDYAGVTVSRSDAVRVLLREALRSRGIGV